MYGQCLNQNNGLYLLLINDSNKHFHVFVFFFVFHYGSLLINVSDQVTEETLGGRQLTCSFRVVHTHHVGGRHIHRGGYFLSAAPGERLLRHSRCFQYQINSTTILPIYLVRETERGIKDGLCGSHASAPEKSHEVTDI